MLDVSKKVVVTGPEGSGTNLLTDIVTKLTGYPRSDPTASDILRVETLRPGMVYHISLPSHRPEVWWTTVFSK